MKYIIQFKNAQPSTLWMWNMALQPSKCWPHSKSSWSVSLEKSITKSQHKRYIFCLFNKTVKHISNYIPHETATFDNRDPPGIKKKMRNSLFSRKMKRIKDMFNKSMLSLLVFIFHAKTVRNTVPSLCIWKEQITNIPPLLTSMFMQRAISINLIFNIINIIMLNVT